MSSVTAVLEGVEAEREAAAQAEALAKEMVLEGITQTSMAGKPVTPTQQEEIIAGIKSGRFTQTEIQSRLAGRRELLNAMAEVEGCKAASIEAAELRASHEAELQSRKAEDDRRKLCDESFESAHTKLRQISARLSDTQTNLRRALASSPKLDLGGNRDPDEELPLIVLERQLLEMECEVLTLRPIDKPGVPNDSKDGDFMRAHHEAMQVYDRGIQAQQTRIDALHAKRLEVESLRATTA